MVTQKQINYLYVYHIYKKLYYCVIFEPVGIFVKLIYWLYKN